MEDMLAKGPAPIDSSATINGAPSEIITAITADSRSTGGHVSKAEDEKRSDISEVLEETLHELEVMGINDHIDEISGDFNQVQSQINQQPEQNEDCMQKASPTVIEITTNDETIAVNSDKAELQLETQLQLEPQPVIRRMKRVPSTTSRIWQCAKKSGITYAAMIAFYILLLYLIM